VQNGLNRHTPGGKGREREIKKNRRQNKRKTKMNKAREEKRGEYNKRE
jgi:hypothetical protein